MSQLNLNKFSLDEEQGVGLLGSGTEVGTRVEDLHTHWQMQLPDTSCKCLLNQKRGCTMLDVYRSFYENRCT